MKSQSGDMIQFPFLPYYGNLKLDVCPEYELWLERWINELRQRIQTDCVASSECIQGILTEQILYGRLRTDWLNIKNELLRDEEGKSISYSGEFGRRLWHFENQWKQNNVNSIFNDMWIDHLYGITRNDQFYAEQIGSMIQDDGWIYNNKLSETQVRTRMKSELTMSMYMGIEILRSADKLEDQLKDRFKATLSSLDNTYFVSAEYFRIRALELLDASNLIPNSYSAMISDCWLDEGFSDFDLRKKVDDYMGTKKRVRHDQEIASPLITSMVEYTANYIEEKYKKEICDHISQYKTYLMKNPLEIKAFRMRDIGIPFGTDITPLEIIAAITLR